MTGKRQDFYPLSPMQQGMLFHSLFAPDSGVYIEQFSCTLQGPLKVAAFEQAWRYMLERHTILRTGFVGQGLKEPVQVVYQQVPLAVRQEDWRALDVVQRQARLHAFMADDRQLGFDLAEPPLMRLALLRVAENAYEFVWTYHHMLLDGWSMPLVLSEFLACYEAFSSTHNGPPPLPPARPYRDYIVWLRKQDLAKAETFWRDTLQGLTAATPLVIDHELTVYGQPRTGSAPAEVEGESYGDREVRLPPEITLSLQTLARRNQLTLNTVVQAAWALLLSRYSGEPDVIFGATVSGRPVDLPGAETMVGLFINTLPIRVRIDEEQSLLAWLQALQAQQAQLQQYQYSPLVQIQGWSDVPRGQPLFETLMVFENYPARPGAAKAGAAKPGESLEIRNIRSVEQTNYPITLVVGVDHEMLLRIIYDNSRLSDAAIVRMLGHLRALLEGMASDASRSVKDLSLLTPSEQRYLLSDLNNTARPDPPYLCAHHWFEAQARETPDNIAVSLAPSGDRSLPAEGDRSVIASPGVLSGAARAERSEGKQPLTYRELNERANMLAHYLRQRGVGPEVLVGLCMERSPDLIVAIMAVLKAGGAYVPLDPAYPPERLAFMIGDFSRCQPGSSESDRRDCRAPIVVTTSELAPLLQNGELPTEVISLDTDWGTITQQGNTENPESGVMPDNLAYVIYTSGSTGVPKGTLLHHRGLCNVVRSFVDAWDSRPGCRILQFFSPSFDGSVSEIFAALLSGSTLCMADRETLSSPPQLWRMLRDQHIDIAFMAPAMWGALPSDPLPDLRMLSAGGEALPPEVVQRWLTPGRTLINYYGPTETTIAVTSYAMERPLQGQGTIPIGRPMPNTSVYILDSRLRPVPIGVPGELCVGGVQLARGYLNRPELTTAKFVPHPFHSEAGTRIYRTGDLVRYLPDGNIEFLGRIDQQVKIRGFRIELGEIEALLGQYPGVQQVAVIAREDTPGNKRLVAYLSVADAGTTPGQEGASIASAPADGQRDDHVLTTGELRSFLQTKLPAYMIPGAFVFLNALPLTPVGKVDRRALPSPEDARSETEREFVPPRDALETQLVRIWEEVLDIQPIGVLDDFFELGGHSLLAVRVIAQVEQAVGIKLPVISLFQEPTIEAMASLLRKASEAARGEQNTQGSQVSLLVKIQPRGSRPPLFFVHPSGGSVHWYTDLARRLGREQPFYGLQARGLEGDVEIDDSIPVMAARYVREMRRVQPDGPYQLGSWSMGVIVAYEMACQLVDQGQFVSLLALLDQGPVLSLPKAEDQAAYLVNTFGQNIPLSVDELRKLPEEEQVPFVYQVARKKRFIYPDVKLEQFRHFIHILRTHTEAWRNLTPRQYPGRVTLFVAEKRPAGEALGPDLGWGALAAGGVEIRHVPGDHLSMVHEPDVRALARELQACLATS